MSNQCSGCRIPKSQARTADKSANSGSLLSRSIYSDETISQVESEQKAQVGFSVTTGAQGMLSRTPTTGAWKSLRVCFAMDGNLGLAELLHLYPNGTSGLPVAAARLSSRLFCLAKVAWPGEPFTGIHGSGLEDDSTSISRHLMPRFAFKLPPLHGIRTNGRGTQVSATMQSWQHHKPTSRQQDHPAPATCSHSFCCFASRAFPLHAET